MVMSADNTLLPPEAAINPVTQDDVFVMPATSNQMRYCWLEMTGAGQFGQVIPLTWECRGPLDIKLVEQAFSALVLRHESLRTTFEVVEGGISQVIHPPTPIAVLLEDISSLAPAEREQAKVEAIRSSARVQMNVEKGPLFIPQVLRLAPDNHLLLLAMHHSICDGWSNGILLRDFCTLYADLAGHSGEKLPALSIQFADYAVWLEEWRQSPAYAESLAYWKRTLGGNFRTLRLPRDRETAPGERNGEIETRLLDAHAVEQSRLFCAQHGVTLYQLLLSVYCVIVERLTGQSDIVVGTPNANRPDGTENVVGLFFNPEIVRVQVGVTDSFNQVLSRIVQWSLNALPYSTLPFEDLRGDEFYSRVENQIPQQIYFLYQKAFMEPRQIGPLHVSPVRSISSGLVHDWMLSIVERDEGIRLQFEFDPGFYNVATIQRILSLYENTLALVVKDASQRILDLPLVESIPVPASTKSPTLAHSLAAKPAAQKSSNSSSKNSTHMPASDALEQQLARIWESVLGVQNLSVQRNFFDAGGTSLTAMRIVARVNKTFSVGFGLATLLSGDTVEKMAQLIRNRLSANTATSLVTLQPEGSGDPLFIVHGAGGNVVRFYPLASLLGNHYPVYGIQAQSLLNGQRGLLRLEDQAALYVSELRKRQPHGPYSLLGYSYGGLLVLEMAHQLRAAGQQIGMLAMLDTWRPGCIAQLRSRTPVSFRVKGRTQQFLYNFGSLSLSEKAGFIRDKLKGRFCRILYGTLLKLGIPTAPHWLIDVTEINIIASRNYALRKWPGRMTLFRAEVQPIPEMPVDLGWGDMMEQGVEVVMLPGDHDLIFREPNVSQFAHQLRDALDRTIVAPPAGEAVNVQETRS